MQLIESIIFPAKQLQPGGIFPLQNFHQLPGRFFAVVFQPAAYQRRQAAQEKLIVIFPLSSQSVPKQLRRELFFFFLIDRIDQEKDAGGLSFRIIELLKLPILGKKGNYAF